MSDKPSQDARVYIDPEYHEKLKELTKTSRRGLGAEVEFLIDQELERRQLRPSLAATGQE